MKPLICADCRWYLPNKQSSSSANYDRCKASETVNLITGEAKYTYCETMRIVNGDCGITGKLFELNQSDEVTHGN